MQFANIPTKTHSSILPLSLQIYLKRKLHQFYGFLTFMAGVVTYSALFSHSPHDSSWNMVNATATSTNLLGSGGAIFSDLLLQFFGITAWFIGLPFLIWGLLTIVFRYIPQKFVLALKLCIAICFISFGFHLLKISSSIAGHFAEILLMEIPPFPHMHIIVGCTFLALGILFYIHALCLSRDDWQKLGHRIYALGNKGATLFSWLLHIKKASPPSKMQRVRLSPLQEEIPTSPHLASDPEVIVTKNDDFITEEISPKIYQPQIRSSQVITKPTAPLSTMLGDGNCTLPNADLLSEPPKEKAATYSKSDLENYSGLLKKVLDDFGIRGDIVSVRPGPVVTLYELVPAPGIKSSRIISLADDIARSMSAISARVSVIPGRNAIGIELPNEKRQTVYLKDLLLDQRYYENIARLPLVLGKDISGAPIIADLSRMPHLLVAGTTGSGKSVGINAMILSLIYRLSPHQCKFIMIDPKMLELSIYDGIPHLLTPVVTDPRKAVVALKWVVREMENRYRAMSQLSVRNIDGYNEKLAEAKKRSEKLTRTVQVGFDNETGRPQYEEQELPMEPLPYIVVIVDEMADLMLVAGKDVEGAIQRLAQMARAAGIHLIMATQRPSVDVITGTIKANFPTRISFQVTSKIDSRTILGEGGAEQLLGQGDMLYMAAGGRMMRVHGPFIKDQDVESVVKFLRSQASPDYINTVTDESEIGGNGDLYPQENDTDDLFQQALELVQRERKASTSFIQRHLKIGYNRAATIMEEMERRGLVSEANHVGKREVLIPTKEAS